MKKNIHKKILLTPGPVPLSNKVKEHLAFDMIHHRASEFIEILNKVRSQLKEIFKTTQNVYIINSNGSGAMEASITNTLSPRDEVLVIDGGKFGQRWYDIAQAFQLCPHLIKIPYGQAVTTKEIEKKLEQFPQIKAILIQACETSTATLHPIKEISKLTKNQPELLLIVDGISALIAVDLPMDLWGIDVLIGGSQKSFALPAGLSFLAFSQKAYAFNKKAQLPRYYFDIQKEKKAFEKNQTAFSTNVSYVRALDISLSEIFEKNLDKIREKYKTLAESTYQFCKLLNLSLFSKSPSPSVTAILIPENIDGLKIKKFMEEQGVTIGGGQDKLQGKIIRFGHMGEISMEDHLQGLQVFGLALRDQDSQIFSLERLNETLHTIKLLLGKQW